MRTVEVPVEVECDYPPTLKYVDKNIAVNRQTVIEKPIIKENTVEVPVEVERPVEVIKENIIYRKVPKFNVIERKISMTEYEVIKKSIDEDRLKVAEQRLASSMHEVAKTHEFDISADCEIDISVEPYTKEDWELNDELAAKGVGCCSVSPSLKHARRVIRLLDEPKMEDYSVVGDENPQLMTRAGFVDLHEFVDQGFNEFMFPPFKVQTKGMPVDEQGVVDIKKAFEKELGGDIELTQSMTDLVRRGRRQEHRDSEAQQRAAQH